MELGVAAVIVCLAAVFLIAFMRGRSGRVRRRRHSAAVAGTDPLTAGADAAPLFVAMDVTALRYWKPSTWSRPDLAVLVPSLIVGIGLGLSRSVCSTPGR